MRRLSSPLLILLAGCAGAEPAEDLPESASVEPLIGVVDRMAFARASEDGVSPGFDLDGVVTEEGGATGCGIGDYVDPEGNPGVDNAFARLIPAIELTEAAAVEDLIQSAINSGALLLMFQIDGLEDPSDDLVDLTVFRGEGTPLPGTDGYLESGQTLDRDDEMPLVRLEDVPILDGRIEARPITLDIPVTVFDVDVVVTLNDGAIRIDLQEDGRFAGLLAGGVSTSYVLEVAQTENVDPDLAGILEGLFALTADLAPREDGSCEQISATFEFQAAPAFVFDEDA